MLYQAPEHTMLHRTHDVAELALLMLLRLLMLFLLLLLMLMLMLMLMTTTQKRVLCRRGSGGTEGRDSQQCLCGRPGSRREAVCGEVAGPS